MRTDHIIASAFACRFLLAVRIAPRRLKTRNFRALGRAALSLMQAIERLEQQGDGKAIGAEFETDGEKVRYEVKILGRDQGNFIDGRPAPFA